MAGYYDCYNCGEIGNVTALKEHPFRPHPLDIGFCPKCGCEISEVLNEHEIRSVAADYGSPDELSILSELGLAATMERKA